MRSLFTGVSGLKVHELRLDVISNNIANVNTTGFKASRVRFDDVLSQTIEIATGPQSGRGGQNPKQIGLGVLGATITRDMSQGSIEITNKTTDLAIQGGGFFVLRDGENIGEWYTRDGGFTVDASGDVVLASNGYRVQGWNGALDTQTNTFVINSSNPVEDMHLNLAQQMAPVATSAVTLGGNLDSRLGTAIDPVRVSWIKNGAEREVEMRFTHVHPTRSLYQWTVYDPSVINAATGDFTQISTDMSGGEVAGIIELDENGRVIANYINTADNDAADPATNFLSTSELPTSTNLWALNFPTRTFNGYDFITLDTDNNGNAIHFEEDSRISSVTSSVNTLDATRYDVRSQVPNYPLSSTALAGGAFPNGFTTDAIYQAGVTAAGNASSGNGLGVPVQYIQSVSNEVVAKIDTARTSVQLAHGNIIDTTRANPAANGVMATSTGAPFPGTDADSLRIFIDGTQYTRISNATAFTAGATQFKLDPDNGVVTFGAAIAAGVNIIASYDYEVRPANSRTIPAAATMTGEFGARAVAGVTTTWTGVTPASIDLSAFYVPGSGSLVIGGETFTEVPASATVNDTSFNRFKIDPSTGAMTIGPMSTGVAVAAASTVTGSYQTFRSWAGEQTVARAAGSTIDSAEVAFLALADSGGQNPPYIPGSVGTIQLTDTSAATTETFSEVAFGTTLGSRQFSVNPATGDLSFGTFFSGAAVDEAADVFANVTHNFKFFNKRIGITDGAGPAGATNARGVNDLWRVLEIPAGGADTGRLNLWLQGDGFNGASPHRPTATSLTYLPTISSTNNIRSEINYNSDDRVNIIIPNGLTKTPNVNPLVDLTTEAFQFTPNTSQITGNAGNNNQANSGDSVSVNLKGPDDYQVSTSVQVYDSLGTPHTMTLRFEKISQNQWLMYGVDPTDPAGERVAVQRLLAFGADGSFDTTSTIPYASPAAAGTSQSTFTGIYFDPPRAGGAAPPNEGANAVSITLDMTNLAQTARTSDAVVTEQNGFPPGKLETFSFNDSGFLVGLFDNGRSLNLARVALQGFVNPSGLISVGGNMFKDTVNAGKYGAPQRPGFDGVGSIVPGALEGSNVDLSVEFVDLIITQRGFQAQSRTITTADQVLQEILSLKR
ncbi:MAG: flagellar hook-basal body complex protein [Candidatus Hydrogenedentota bacterium]